MKQKTILIASICLVMLSSSCVKKTEKSSSNSLNEITQLLDSLNTAAATADYSTYFSYFTETATFNGTDATENWDKKAYMIWAKPYFDAKTTWNFKAVKRNIYFGNNDNIAWFEELLDTQMKICRGSGVVVKENGTWKIQQYVLSMTVPNSKLDSVVALKALEEDSLLLKLKK
jgi:hypothetical protein